MTIPTPSAPGVIDSNNPDPLSHWDLETFGLHITPIKLPSDILAIYHIEKPPRKLDGIQFL